MQHLWTLLAYRPIYTRQVESQAENPVLEGSRDYTKIIPRLYQDYTYRDRARDRARERCTLFRDLYREQPEIIPGFIAMPFRELSANKENAPRLYRDYTGVIPRLYRGYTGIYTGVIPGLYRGYTEIYRDYTAKKICSKPNL